MLSKQRMEATVLLEVDRARKDRKGYEGTFVELKRSLPEDRRRAARQLAAICNAARGEQVLWLVGIDDKTGDVRPPYSVDIQDWWPGVVRYFDDVPPDMSSIAVSVGDGETVLALFFETDRAPYVVTTDGQGQAQLEVPWRDGTTTRSAKRRELLRMLAPAISLPTMDPLHATITSYANVLEFYFSVFLDITQPVALPRHRQQVTVTIGTHTDDLEIFPNWKGDPSALRVDSPVEISLYARGEPIPHDVLRSVPEARFRVAISVSGTDSRTIFENIAHRTVDDEQQVTWYWAAD